MKIKNHKLEGVPYVPATKKMGDVFKPRGIVLHFTAGWTTEGDIHTLAKSDRKASAHCVLSREGEWTQIVPFNRIAWHAGPSEWKGLVGLNNYYLGLEVCNIGYLKKLSNGEYHDEYGNRLNGDGDFLNSKRKAHSAPKDWHEHYNKILAPGPKYVWEPFYAPQLDALEEGVRAMLAAYPSIDDITTHEDIDTRGWKTDINGGRAFPMRRFTSLLARDDYNNREENKTDAVVQTRHGAIEVMPEPVTPPVELTVKSADYPQPVAEVVDGASVKIIHADEKWAFIEFAGGLKGWLPRVRLRVG